MEYFANSHPPRGEICFRGAPVIKGYFKMPDKTAEAIDQDGWLHSGDVGELRPNGSIKIIDRKKNIFKLSQGEYVAPEKIENIYNQIPIIAQSFIHGDSHEASVVGIFVPDEPTLKKWAEAHDKEGDFKHLCKDEDVKKFIIEEIKALSKEKGLLGFEVPREIMLISDAFTPDNDILTPTFKLKRNIAAKLYEDDINRMYGKSS
jgi:long-chain acyl-CoA synthetase